MTIPVSPPIDVDLGELRQAIQAEYAEVALPPRQRVPFPHRSPAGAPARLRRCLARGHSRKRRSSSFAGTGNPFSLGELRPGEHVVDVGCWRRYRQSDRGQHGRARRAGRSGWT